MTPLSPQAKLLCDAWGFHPLEELPGGHCSHVYADDSRVLKVPYQGEELTSGFSASLLLGGSVGPKIFQSDQASGIVLMERLRPGNTLEFEDEERAIKVACDLILKIRSLDQEGLMPLSEFMPQHSEVGERLLGTALESVFMHGDLHHSNILRKGEDWAAIDPKGLFGDPAYEPVAFLRNPLARLSSYPDFLTLSRKRIYAFAEKLSLDPWRICAWVVVDLEGMDDPNHPWTLVLKTFEILEAEFRGV